MLMPYPFLPFISTLPSPSLTVIDTALCSLHYAQVQPLKQARVTLLSFVLGFRSVVFYVLSVGMGQVGGA